MSSKGVSWLATRSISLSITVYYIIEHIVEGTPRDTHSFESERETPSRKVLQLSLEHISLPRGKLRMVPINNGMGSLKTLHKITSSPSVNNKFKGYLLLTKKGVCYRMTVVVWSRVVGVKSSLRFSAARIYTMSHSTPSPNCKYAATVHGHCNIIHK